MFILAILADHVLLRLSDFSDDPPIFITVRTRTREGAVSADSNVVRVPRTSLGNVSLNLDEMQYSTMGQFSQPLLPNQLQNPLKANGIVYGGEGTSNTGLLSMLPQQQQQQLLNQQLGAMSMSQPLMNLPISNQPITNLPINSSISNIAMPQQNLSMNQPIMYPQTSAATVSTALPNYVSRTVPGGDMTQPEFQQAGYNQFGDTFNQFGETQPVQFRNQPIRPHPHKLLGRQSTSALLQPNGSLSLPKYASMFEVSNFINSIFLQAIFVRDYIFVFFDLSRPQNLLKIKITRQNILNSLPSQSHRKCPSLKKSNFCFSSFTIQHYSLLLNASYSLNLVETAATTGPVLYLPPEVSL